MKKLFIILFGLLFVSGCGNTNILGATNKLKASKDKILKSELVTDEKGDKFIKYDYISDVEVPKFSDKEDLSKRTNNSYTEVTGKKINGKDVLKTTFYGGAPFIKEGTKWMQTETGTSTEKDYTDSTKLTLFDKFKELLGGSAYANINTIYPTVDGYAARNISTGNTYATVRSATGNAVTYSGTNISINLTSTNTTTANLWSTQSRGLFVFDTSFLGSSAIISSSTFTIFFYSISTFSNFGTSFYLAQGNTASTTVLAGADYGLSLNYTIKLSDSSISSAVGNQPFDFLLNSDGLNNINKTGFSKFSIKNNFDITSTTPTWSSNKNDFLRIYISPNTGLDYDPKLVIEYTTSSTPSTPIYSSVINFE